MESNRISEQRALDELTRSRDAIIGDHPSPVAQLLRERYPGIANAYVIEWTPEQAEDLYSVLISGRRIVSMELDRSTGAILDGPHEYTIAEYRQLDRGARKPMSKLSLALKLLNEVEPEE